MSNPDSMIRYYIVRQEELSQRVGAIQSAARYGSARDALGVLLSQMPMDQLLAALAGNTTIFEAFKTAVNAGTTPVEGAKAAARAIPDSDLEYVLNEATKAAHGLA